MPLRYASTSRTRRRQPSSPSGSSGDGCAGIRSIHFGAFGPVNCPSLSPSFRSNASSSMVPFCSSRRLTFPSPSFTSSCGIGTRPCLQPRSRPLAGATMRSCRLSFSSLANVAASGSSNSFPSERLMPFMASACVETISPTCVESTAMARVYVLSRRSQRPSWRMRFAVSSPYACSI